MELKGKRLDLLERAEECAQILGHPKHTAARFTNLTPGDRGMAVALQEYVDKQVSKLHAEMLAFIHKLSTSGDTE